MESLKVKSRKPDRRGFHTVRKLIIRDPKSRKAYSFLKRLPIGLKIISGKMKFMLKIAFFRYAMKLPDQWLRRQEIWLVFI